MLCIFSNQKFVALIPGLCSHKVIRVKPAWTEAGNHKNMHTFKLALTQRPVCNLASWINHVLTWCPDWYLYLIILCSSIHMYTCTKPHETPGLSHACAVQRHPVLMYPAVENHYYIYNQDVACSSSAVLYLWLLSDQWNMEWNSGMVGRTRCVDKVIP